MFFAGFEKRAGLIGNTANIVGSAVLGGALGGALGVKNPATGKREHRKERASRDATIATAGAVGGILASVGTKKNFDRAESIFQRAKKTGFGKRSPKMMLGAAKPLLAHSGAMLAGSLGATYLASKAINKYKPISGQEKVSFFSGFEKASGARTTARRIKRQFVDPLVSREVDKRRKDKTLADRKLSRTSNAAERKNRFFRGLEKRADTFYHRTSNLDPILQSGQIRSLRHISQTDPKKKISVEPGRWERERKKLPAAKAYEEMKEKKDVDHVFLTKDRPIKDESYGKYIIQKDTKRPHFAKNLNMIPSEYKQKQPISVKRTTTIFAPGQELSKLQKKYPGFKFKDSAEIKDYHPGYSVGSFINKVMANAGVKVAEDLARMSEARLKKAIGKPAHIGGSTALGLNIPGSDVDIFVPYKRKQHFEKAKERVAQKFPELKPSPFNKPGADKFVLTGPNVDVALAYGPRGQKRVESVEQVKKRLSPEDAARIRKEKQRIKNSFFFPKRRYKKYKRDLDRKLGLYKW